MKAKILENLQNTGDLYCLHFDGKKVQGEEYQVVVLRNPSNEIKLGILRCETGSSKHIYKELRQLINDYNAWTNICMIICDTTAVNTGRLQGVVKLIQDDFMKNEESIIDIPMSKEIVERAVKLMEVLVLHKRTKKLVFFNLKFIVKNDF